MSFKLYSDAMVDLPMLVCDTCHEKIVDVWNDKASGSPGSDGKVTDVVIHHAKCAGAGSVHIPLIDFLKLLVVQYRLGSLGSNGVTDKVTLEYPSGKGFEA